jgi:ferric-dicitrate binding protein FerR (iron transport regulator)
MKPIQDHIEKAKNWLHSILEGKKISEIPQEDRNDFQSLQTGEYANWRKDTKKYFNKERDWKRLESNLQSKKKSKTIPLYRYWQSVAAVLVIGLLAAAGYWLYSDMKKVEEQIILPGSSVAYLEIDNQQKIELTAKDSLLLFHDTKAEVDSGRIVYSGAEAKRKKAEYHKINVPRNGEFYVELSDGTKVWVNSASSIGFKSRFDGKYRVVDLVGEAYFEVAKNAEQPFVVRTNNMDVRVLGTHFNIKAYPDETHTYATLNEGKIQVSKGELNEILAPDQQLSLNNSTKEFTREEVDASIYSAWVRGKFVFKDERLDDILNALSRWYDVKIFYQDQNLQDDRFSLSVNRYDDIETLLNHLRLIGGVDFEVNDGVLVVK